MQWTHRAPYRMIAQEFSNIGKNPPSLLSGIEQTHLSRTFERHQRRSESAATCGISVGGVGRRKRSQRTTATTISSNGHLISGRSTSTSSVGQLSRQEIETRRKLYGRKIELQNKVFLSSNCDQKQSSFKIKPYNEAIRSVQKSIRTIGQAGTISNNSKTHLPSIPTIPDSTRCKSTKENRHDVVQSRVNQGKTDDSSTFLSNKQNKRSLMFPSYGNAGGNRPSRATTNPCRHKSCFNSASAGSFQQIRQRSLDARIRQLLSMHAKNQRLLEMTESNKSKMFESSQTYI